MTPQDFIAKWRASSLKESAAAQEHFIDLCRLLAHPTPAEADPDGTWFTFEKGVSKITGSQGWADVWKKGFFGWEYKGKHKDLDKALVQLQQYAVALENPFLLVVSDMDIIRIHTNFSNTVQEIHVLRLEDLADPAKLQILKHVFSAPEHLKPGRTRDAVTAEVARDFAGVAQRLRERGYEAHRVAHFISKLLFCMFAEDAMLFKDGRQVLTEILEACTQWTEHCTGTLRGLFAAMSKGGIFGTLPIDRFNGGLFADDDVIPLEREDIKILLRAARQDWKDIEPSIFGTLFERGLDPDKRSQLGAHYTHPGDILRILNPLFLNPLREEWSQAKQDIEAAIEKSKSKKNVPKAALDRFNQFMQRLADVRVLDPACGSGNFLYLALSGLKDLEHQANIEAEALGLPRQFSLNTGPRNVLGIEVNPYAAELARVTIWIGHIQWMVAHGYNVKRNPVLDPLEQIHCRDAIFDAAAGTEPEWPEADYIVGNPPFLGDKKMIDGLGEDYVTRLRKLYQGRVPGGADLVTYWFEKARAQLVHGKAKAAGLVSTNSIRGGANRKVLERIRESGRIFNAWSDEPWVNEGAAVRVSLVCFEGGEKFNTSDTKGTKDTSVSDLNARAFCASSAVRVPFLLDGSPAAVRVSLVCFDGGEKFNTSDTKGTKDTSVSDLNASAICASCVPFLLDGAPVAEIYADLTGAAADGVDLASAKPLPENQGVSFIGTQKNGPFDIFGDLAREWLQLPANPNGRPNSDVLRPWANGMDITRRPSDTWIIDFGTDMPEEDAALYEKPFEHVVQHVKPMREGLRREGHRKYWWRYGETRPGMRRATAKLSRYIVTPRVAKHRFFVWKDGIFIPDSRLTVIARADNTTFGILHSHIHEVWSLATCSWHGVGNDPTYNAKSVFETFPFPAGLTPNIPAEHYADDPRAQKIAAAAKCLDNLRNNWLNPPEWVVRKEEVVAGYPERILPKDENAAQALKKRTLTNLYNQRPAWLANAHKALDAAVAEAYGWEAELADEEILRRLLALNLERSGG